VGESVGYTEVHFIVPMRPRRIAILWPSGHLDRCPPVINLATLLARNGYEIDIYSAQNRTAATPTLTDPGVQLRLYPHVQESFREPVISMTAGFWRWVLPQIRASEYAVVIGTGIRGLLVAAALSLQVRAQFAYYSLEIYSRVEAIGLRRKFYKGLERWANRRMDFSISQDAMRAEMLATENRIARQSVALLPVAPLGPVVPRTNYLRQRFSIPNQKKILLYMGTLFAEFSPIPELIDAAQHWPDDWVLVLHNSARAPENSYAEWRDLDKKGRVVFSVEPVPYERLSALVASADIGLTVYRATDQNMHFMGLASGKISEYLRCGLPVVASDLPGMADLVRETDCGMVVEDVSKIGSAVTTILKDEAGFGARAEACFHERLALESQAGELLRKIALLSAKESDERSA